MVAQLEGAMTLLARRGDVFKNLGWVAGFQGLHPHCVGYCIIAVICDWAALSTEDNPVGNACYSATVNFIATEVGMLPGSQLVFQCFSPLL